MKEVALASSTGLVVTGGTIYPRLYMITVDQPAAMSLLCHKKSNCGKECDKCDLHTAGNAEMQKHAVALKRNAKDMTNKITEAENILKLANKQRRELARMYKTYDKRLRALSSLKHSAARADHHNAELPIDEEIAIVMREREDSLVDKLAGELEVKEAEEDLEGLRKSLAVLSADVDEIEETQDAEHVSKLEQAGSSIDYCRVTHLQLLIASSELEMAAIKRRKNANGDETIESMRHCASQMKMLTEQVKNRIKPAVSELHSMSFNSCVSSLESFEGMVTKEKRMGLLLGLDSLHVSAEGSNRELCDGICKVVGSREWSVGAVSKAETIRRINLALSQLPAACALPGAARVRESMTEQQSGQSGSLRRKLPVILPLFYLGYDRRRNRRRRTSAGCLANGGM